MTALAITEIKIDGGTQTRAALNDSVVSEYAEAIVAGAKMPPVVVFFDGSSNWLADGFHRFHAHRKAGKKTIPADVRTGTKRDAILYSVGANSDHGLRRSNEDKRRSVMTLLQDAEWAAWSDREIAKACGVSHPFVAAIRQPAVAVRQQAARVASTTRRVESDSTPASAPVQQVALSKPPAKPEPKSAKPQKGEPTIEGLQAEIEALKAELHEARHVAEELAHDLESYNTVSEGEAAVARELKRLKAQLRTVEATRDQWMTTANELRREVKSLQRKQGVRQ